MIKIVYLVFLFSIIVSKSVYACLNSYVDEINVNVHHSDKLNIEEVIERLNKSNNYKEMNDDAVLLIRAGKYHFAIQFLEKIEKSHPNLPKTAANLGTAYELIGRHHDALKWIELGIQRDSTIHESSEWIHQNILKAKIVSADTHWLNHNPLLHTHFGNYYFPKPINSKGTVLSNDEIQRLIDQAAIQIRERLQFVKGEDPLLAHLYYELSNLEYSLYEPNVVNRAMNSNYKVSQLIESSKQLGLKTDVTMQKRLVALESRSVQYMWLRLKDGVLKLWGFIK